MVAILHPAWDRSCATCEKYLPKDDGTLLRDRRTSLPLLRTREPTPCHKCPKIPIAIRAAGGDPRVMRLSACDLTAQDRASWAFFRKCRATLRFPDDPIVDWYSEILAGVYEVADREPMRLVAAGLESLTAAINKRGV